MTVVDQAPPPQQLSLGDVFDARPNRRLFMGLWPDIGAVGELSALMGRLRRDGIMRGRPVDDDRLHVTLFHLDDFVDQIPPSLVAASRAAAASLRFRSFDVVFDRVCCTRRHVLLMPSDELVALREFRARLGEALVVAGARRRIDSAYNPHVTLSYAPGEAADLRVEPIRWRVRGFHLVESLLGQHRHIRLDSWMLEP